MAKTVKVFLTSAITFNGAIVDKGESIELPEKSAQALINEGTASESKKEALEASNENGEQTPTGDDNGSQDESYALNMQALNDKYVGRIPELKEHAKEADVQFPHDATKGEIIEAIVQAGKAEAILAK